MPISPEQLSADVAYLTEQPEWQDETKRRDYIRRVAQESRSSLPADEVDAVVLELWKKADEKSLLAQSGEFVGTAVGEVVKSVPALGGAGVAAASDLAGTTDTGSGTRLKRGVADLIDTTGQLLKRALPGDSNQAVRDNSVDLLKEEIDTNQIPEGVKDWASGAFDISGLDTADPETREYVDAIVGGIAQKAVEADYMGEVDPAKVRSLLDTDRNPGRAEGDIPGTPGPRDFLADYMVTKDPASWAAFKQRVTETEAQHKTRMQNWLASRNLQEYIDKLPADSLEREMLTRSMEMQGSPIDLATAVVPLFRGAKALAAARASEKGLSVATQLAKGAAIEGAQEGATELLSNPQTTLGDVAYNAALGAVGGGIVEGTGTAAGSLMRPKPLLKADIGGTTVLSSPDGVISKVVDPVTSGGRVLQPLNPLDPADAVLLERADAVFSVARADMEPAVTPPPAPVEQVAEEVVTPDPGVSPGNEAQNPAVSLDQPTSLDPGLQAPVEEVVVNETPAPEQQEVLPPTVEGQAPAPVATAPSPTGIANARVDEARAARGLERIYEPVRQSNPETWDKAVRTIDQDPLAGQRLVEDLNSNPRTISADEVGILLYEQVTRINEFDQAVEAFNTALPEQKEAARLRMDTAQANLSKVFDATEVAGTKQGQSLQARRILANLDYTFAKMVSLRQAANNGAPLTDEQLAETAALQAEIADLRRQLAEYEAVASDVETQNTLDQALKEANAELTAENQAAQGKGVTEFLEDEAAKARARKRARRARTNFGPALLLADAADDVIIGASYIARGLKNFKEWADAMVAELGETVRPLLPEYFKRSQALQAKQEKNFTKAKTRTKEKRTLEVQIAANAMEGNPPVPRLVYEAVKAKLKEGLRGLGPVMKAVTADFQKSHPEITERQIRDIFSGYGKVKYPSQEELQKQARELRSIAQLQSAIEDAQAKIAPLASGPKRDAATQQMRDMRKELNRLMKENGIKRTTARQQLKTALDGVKSRLRNQIEDLETQIKEGAKRPQKPGVEYDQEAKDLRNKRDTLKKALDELEGPEQVSPQDRVEQAMQALDRQIADLEKRIKERNFAPASETTPLTEQLQVKRDQRDALREQFNALRDESLGSPELTQEQINEQAEKTLRKSIAELERRIKEQDFSRPKGAPVETTPEIFKLRSQKEALQEQLAELRLAIEGKKEPTDAQRIEKAEKVLDAQIERLEKQIAEGDVMPKSRVDKTPPTQNLQVKRDQRDALSRIVKDMRKARRNEGRDFEAEQLARDKASIRRRIQKLEERLANRDFSTPAKRTPMMDAERRELEKKLEDKQEQWAEILYEEKLRNRSLPARLIDTGSQILNTARAILTSVDVSAVFRQGGFIALGNPVRAASSLKPMFKALVSKDAEFNERKDLAARENFQNGLYQQAKLFLADTGKVNQLQKQEENFMSRWLDKIPTAAGGGIIRGSQRAYTVFLNRLRADTFDAMLQSLQNGPTPTLEEAKAVANYVNVATGRGGLWKFDQAAQGLNTVFFAPRLVASRFQLLGAQPFFKAGPRVKKLVLREYAKFLTGAALVYALGSLAQDDEDPPIETDPRSSDFGKIRFGNTRVDPMGGLIQATVFLSRVIAGEKKSASGKIVPLRQEYRFPNLFREIPRTDKVPYKSDTTMGVAGTFVRSKFSPAFGSLANIIDGENVVGEPTDLTTEAKRMVIPMSISEAIETMKEQGIPEGTALTILSLFGFGVQTYDMRK